MSGGGSEVVRVAQSVDLPSARASPRGCGRFSSGGWGVLVFSFRVSATVDLREVSFVCVTETADCVSFL